MSAVVTTRTTGLVPRTPAVIAGGALLLMAALAGWAAVAVLQPLVAAPDPVETLAASIGAVRAAAAALLLVAVLDVIVAWALLDVLRATEEAVARLAAWLRTAYAAGFVVAVAHVLVAVELVDAGGATDAELGQAVARELITFQTMWDVGLLLIGLHLVLIGYALWRTHGFPRWLGALVALAGLDHTVDALAVVLTPRPLWELTTVTFVGEVVMAVWLLVRARTDRRAGPVLDQR